MSASAAKIDKIDKIDVPDQPHDHRRNTRLRIQTPDPQDPFDAKFEEGLTTTTPRSRGKKRHHSEMGTEKTRVNIRGENTTDLSSNSNLNSTKTLTDSKGNGMQKSERSQNITRLVEFLGENVVTNEVYDYFKSTIDVERQCKLLVKAEEVHALTSTAVPRLVTLLDASIPPSTKAVIIKKMNVAEVMLDDGNSGHAKASQWVDGALNIPFDTYAKIPIDSKTSSSTEMNAFLQHAKQTLDEATYGMEDAKLQVMTTLGRLIANPTAPGQAIAFFGPPGTGKTSLVKNGLCKILNRPFEFIAMGGATDSAMLNGHLSTWEGSMYGRIVQGLINAKCMNPIFYFDEIDKISGTHRGDELKQLLVNLIDPEQNDVFKDNYFSEFSLDISKCMFVFSGNDMNAVPPVLLNRIEPIEIMGYNSAQALIIGQQFILPKILKEHDFLESDIIVSDDVMAYIIDNKVVREDGVRNLKRFISHLISKINLAKLMDSQSRKTILNMPITECESITFPYTLTKNMIDVLEDQPKKMEAWKQLYI